MKVVIGQFVTVIAHANLTDGTGKILYVNPASRAIESTSDVGRSTDFELIFYDASGNVLHRVHPMLRIPASVSTSGPPPPNTHALIQENIPLSPGMASVALLYKNKETARFESSPLAAEALSMTLGPTPGAGSHRLAPVGGAVLETSGATYTVLVQKDGETLWHAIAVGKTTPDFELDRNQFPGVKKVTVRVLRTTGFEQTQVSEQDVDLGY